MSIEDACETDAATPEPPIFAFERKRSRIGLAPLTPEGRVALEWAISQKTPAAARLEQVLALGEELGALVLPSEDVDAWVSALARIDTLAYCTRLIEAQIIAGNTDSGIMLPDPDLVA